MMKPTGPFSKVARPMAPKIPASSQGCPKSQVWANQKHTKARVMKNVRIMSKTTRRAKAITRGDVAQTRPALSAAESPNIRFANNQVRKAVAGAASAEGNRAAHSDSPHIRNDSASSQKKSAGLSR